MKKIIICLILSIMVLPNYTIVQAQVNNIDEVITTNRNDLGNGITKEIIIKEDLDINLKQNSSKSGSKTINFKNGTKILWSITIHGTFSYNGSSATCTNSYVSTTCPASDWKIIKANATKRGSSAIGTVEAKKYFLGLPVQTVDDTVTLTCNKTGTLS